MPPDPARAAAHNPREQTYRSLVEAIAGGAVLFVGAGSSRKVGYPMWGGLLSELEAAARKVDEAQVTELEGADGLLRANTYKQILGPAEYQRILRETFAARTPPHDAVHEALVRIPFRHIFTTNYDGVLQSAHQAVRGSGADSFDADEWDKLSELWHRQAGIGAVRAYVHLHGSIGRPQGIVLCKDEYDQRYYREQRYTQFLRGFLTSHRFVFVGFSLADDEFKYILRWAHSTWQPPRPRHFAILPAPSNADEERVEAVNLRGLQGIEPVYFDNTAGEFTNLWALIENLRIDVEAHRAQNGLVPAAALSDFVADLFLGDPDRQQAALQQLPSLVSKYAVTFSLIDAGAGSCTGIDREIDAVFKLVDRGLPDDAIAAYEAIRAREGERLTAKQQYRLDANIGNALYSKDETTLASRAYLRAVGHYNESRDAKGIELLGRFLAGDIADAMRRAETLCATNPTYERAWTIWIRAHSGDDKFHEIEAAVPIAMQSQAEVALALSDLAFRCGDADAHVRHARTAVTAEPNWSESLAMLGAAIVSSERRFAALDIDRGLVPRDPALFEEAERVISRAIDAVGQRDPARRRGGLYFNRSVTRRYLGREEDANRDLLEAFRLEPHDPAIAIGFAMEAESKPDMEAAMAALMSLPADAEWSDQAQIAGVVVRLRRRAEGDIVQARAMVDELCDRLATVEPSTHRGDIVRLALRVCHEEGRAVEGPGIVVRASHALQEHEHLVLLARAHLLAGAREQGIEIASAAAGMIREGASWFDLRAAAELAQECGLYSDAVRLWQVLLPRNYAGSDTEQLVRAAYYAREWRTVLDVCKNVRAAGRITRRHLEIEVDVLAASREVGRAIELLSEWVAVHPKDKLACLHLSTLALYEAKPHLAVFDESRLPSVSELAHPSQGAALIYVLRRGPAPERSLEIAYNLYRRFPEHADSQRALVGCVIDPSASPLTIDRHQQVGDGAAVFVRRHAEPPRWIYVESAPDPVASRGEFPTNHEFVKSMWGRTKGDSFEYLDHQYEILGVENRIVRRVHDIMERYEENFPDNPAFRRFSAPSSPPPDAPIEERLGEMYGELKKQESHRQLLESMYRKNRLPIAAFAAMRGLRVFDLVRYLVSDRTMGVRADDGDPARWTQALVVASDCKELVLDGTVLAGALVLDVLAELPKLGVKLVVPQAVLDELRELSLEAGSSRSPIGTIGLHRGKLLFHESSPEQIAQEVARIESVIQCVHSHCEVVGGEATLDLPTNVKEVLEGLLDGTSIDAVALAVKRSAPLWTDDLGLQRLLQELGLGIPAVWTQAVLRAAMERSQISGEIYERVLGRLLERGYAFTRVSAAEMIAVLRHAHWRTDDGPGEAVIRVVCDVAIMNPHNQFITALFIKGVWTECPQRDMAKRIIVAILERIGRRRSRPLLARFIYRFRAFHPVQLDRQTPLARMAGTGGGSAWAHVVTYTFDPFGDKEGGLLKRFLRSWSSRDGECKPSRVAASRSVSESESL